MNTLITNSGRTITLRELQPGDEHLVYNYAQKLQAEDVCVLLNPHEPVTWEEELQYVSDSLAKMRANWQIHYLAFDADQMVGSSQITLLGRRKKHHGSFGISLHKDYRGDGIGSQFSQFMLKNAKEKLNLSLVSLEVFATNTRAIKLYGKLGFQEYGRLPGGLLYKGESVDSVVMCKHL